jgi:hypothetical protein
LTGRVSEEWPLQIYSLLVSFILPRKRKVMTLQKSDDPTDRLFTQQQENQYGF